MINKTKGQLEAEISAAITSFEKNHLGRGPNEARTFIIEDMILIRLKGVLTPAERKLAMDDEGAQIIKHMRRRLIESSRPLLEEIIRNITGSKIISLHTDVSSRTGERIFVLCLDENLELKIENSKNLKREHF
ncbi:MAG: DUF2294 domain-containing protein [Calditrichaeota bacterium]|nr:DUF2294 domain-containing protein [Calditrichota bacterium]